VDIRIAVLVPAGARLICACFSNITGNTWFRVCL
jgi:hypothetical protein